MTKQKSKKPTPKKTGGKSTSGAKDLGQGTGSGAGGAAIEHYVVLARKYRPNTFDDLIGQDAMVQTLRNAFATGRIAQAYMLTGVRGVGKTTTARILARGLNYETGDGDRTGGPTVDLPELGAHCEAIMESRHPDVVEMDAASNTGVDNVREIIESARYRPISARYKVFIIDEVHMLSKGAFNALLKTLEEPPEHVKFIFATTESRKVPVTVLSRCQRFDLRRVEAALLTEHFARIVEAEGGNADDEALRLIARAAEGSVRDGLSVLDQAIAIGSGTVSADRVKAMLGLADRGRVLDLLETLLGGDIKGALEQYDVLHRDGAEPGQILSDLAEAAHLVSRQKVAGEGAASDALSAEERGHAGRIAAKLSVPLTSRAWQALVKGYEEAGRAPDAFAAGEMVLIRIGYMAGLPSPDDLMRKLDAVQRIDASEAASQAVEGGNGEVRPEARSQTPTDAPLEPVGIASFADVVAIAGSKRDIRLKLELEEKVRLVAFKQGHIEINLDPGATAALASELSQKLTKWTGARWLVVVSGEGGGKTIAEKNRAQRAAELELVEAHGAVKAVREHFPGAEIKDVRSISSRDDEDSQAS